MEIYNSGYIPFESLESKVRANELAYFYYNIPSDISLATEWTSKYFIEHEIRIFTDLSSHLTTPFDESKLLIPGSKSKVDKMSDVSLQDIDAYLYRLGFENGLSSGIKVSAAKMVSYVKDHIIELTTLLNLTSGSTVKFVIRHFRQFLLDRTSVNLVFDELKGEYKLKLPFARYRFVRTSTPADILSDKPIIIVHDSRPLMGQYHGAEEEIATCDSTPTELKWLDDVMPNI